MFFKKKETEIDDDFDDMDDFDDFGLEESGFNDSTPKSGARKAISTIKGGFFSGIKSNLLDPTVHRKILKESLPEGYVSHYDDARDVVSTTKSLYNTADKEARALAKVYAAEVQPSVKAWDEKSKSKFSARVSKLVGVKEDDTGQSENTISPQQQAWDAAANDVFGNTMAKATADGVQNLTEETSKANIVGQGLQKQSNELMTNISNTLHGQSAFNEQVALKWKKKSLEIQFKQYFTARKQLDIQTKQHEHLNAVLPVLVKNTALPDVVKMQTSELATQLIAQKWIGGISDTVHGGFSNILGTASDNLKKSITEKMQAAQGGAGMLGSVMGMFNDDSGFGTTPQEMILEMIGGAAASGGMNWLVNKSTGKLKEKVEGSNVDFELHNENLKLAKHQTPAILANLVRDGTGIGFADKLLEMMGIDGMVGNRNTLLQGSMEDELESQALFDLETKKSITFTIPGLLSEIHGELSSVRSGLGIKGPDNDDKLRMDWSAGRLNTAGKMRQNLDNKLFGKSRSDSINEVMFNLLEKMGFDKEKIKKDYRVEDKDGNVLLSSRDLTYLSIAFKAASYDKTKFFDVEELANGSPLITDPEARANVAEFFTNTLNISGSDDLSHSTDILGSKKRRLQSDALHKVKIQNYMEEAKAELNSAGIPESVYKNAVKTGNVDLLSQLGVVTQAKDGSFHLDELADATRLQTASRLDNAAVNDMYRDQSNDLYGAQDRTLFRIKQAEEARAKKEAEAKKLAEEEAARKEAARTGSGPSKVERARNIFKRRDVVVKNIKEKVDNTTAEVNSFANRAAGAVVPEEYLNAETGGIDLRPSDVGNFLKDKTKDVSEKLSDMTFTQAKDIVTETVDGILKGTKKNTQKEIKAFNNKGYVFRSPEYDEYINSSILPSAITEATFKPTERKAPTGIDLNAPRKSLARVTGGKSKEKVEDTGLSDIQKDQTVSLAAQVAVTMSNTISNRGKNPHEPGTMNHMRYNTYAKTYANWKTQRGEYSDLHEDEDIDNLFFGGTVGRIIQNFKEGGEVTLSSKNKRYLSKLFAPLRKKPDEESFVGPMPPPIQGPMLPEESRFNRMLNPIKDAWQREKDLGGKPQLIVASEGEEVLSTDNGDASLFRKIKGMGIWKTLSNNEDKLDTLTGIINRRLGDSETDTLGDHDDPLGLKQAVFNINHEPSNFDLKRPTHLTGQIEGIDGKNTTEEMKAKALGHLLGVKDFTTDKYNAFTDLFSKKLEGGISLPSLNGGATNTMSHQLAEMIRLTGHIAINTGSDPSILEETDATLIAPYSEGKASSNKTGFFKGFKERFKREGDSDDKKESTWSKIKNRFSSKEVPASAGEKSFVGPMSPPTEEEEEEKRRGLLGSLLGLSWGTTKVVGKGGWWTTKGIGKLGLFGAKGAYKGTGALLKGTEGSSDIYLEGHKKPVMLARDMQEGMYLDKETGIPILTPEDISGAVLDSKGNYVITEEDYNDRKVQVITKEGRSSLLVRGAKGAFSASAGLTKFGAKVGWTIGSTPFKLAFADLNKKIDTESTDVITKDIYVKGDPAVRIRAKFIDRGEYSTKDKTVVTKYSQLVEEIYNQDGNLVLSLEDLEKGLITPDGNPVSKLMGFGFKTTGGIIKGAYKISSGLLKLTGSIIGGGFNLATGAGKGLWSSLQGKGFDVDGMDKHALMIQAQAATVDKLETIRILLDERLELKEKKFNDKDGDGVRDGSYLDQLREKTKRKKEKEEERKRKEAEKKGDKDETGGFASAIAQGMGMFFTRNVLFAALGGLVAANFGPQIATGIFSGIRTLLPRWLGGYDDEKKAQIASSGGAIAHMFNSGKSGSSGDLQTTPQVDENGNPIESTEEAGGYSTLTKAAFGLGTAGVLMNGVGKTAKSVVGAPFKAAKFVSDKTGLTRKIGLAGMGKTKAAGHILKGTGKGLWKGSKLLGRGVLGGGRMIGTGLGAVKSAVASTGLRTAAMTGLKALPALAATPVGMAVIAVAATAAIAYAGYKLYKYLSNRDNHLTQLRMAQYGYEMKNSKVVTKLLDLEQYLSTFTSNATASTSAKISTQANSEEVLKIFGINKKSEEEVNKFYEWYYYRFKPIYLTWKTLLQRSEGTSDLSKIDERLLLEDKFKIIELATFEREQQNPYDTPTSPFKNTDHVDVTHEGVVVMQEKVIKELSKVNAEEHDRKVRQAGGGKGRNTKQLNSITEMTASSTNQQTTAKQLSEEEKRAELQEKRESKAAKVRYEKEVKEQSFFNKLMFGDREKAKEKNGPWQWGQKAAKNVREGIANMFSGGSEGTYDASSKTLNLSQQDIEDIIKVTSTEVAHHLPEAEQNRQAAAIVDTIINRAAAKNNKFGGSIREVINQRKQFSKITGPARIKPYGSIQAMPLSHAKAKIRTFVPAYLEARVKGHKPLVPSDLNYLNPDHSDKSNLKSWGNDVVAQAKRSGQVYGKGNSVHYHGTTSDNKSAKPFGFKIAMNGKVSPPQGKGRNSSSNGIMGTSASSLQGGTTPPSRTPTSTTDKPLMGTGPVKDAAPRTAPSIDMSMQSVTSKPGAGSTATGPSLWTKTKNAVVDMHRGIAAASTGGNIMSGTPEAKAAKAAREDGNMVAPQMTKNARPAKAAANATKAALKDSTGWCARYVRNALQKAGYPEPGTPRGSAYMYASGGLLVKMGFQEINSNSRPQIGDVAVVMANSKSKHGHICIWNNKEWVSDFKHPKPNVYGVPATVRLFRDKQFLNSAPVSITDDGYVDDVDPSAPKAYQLKFDDALGELKKRQERRDEIVKQAKAKYIEKDIPLEFKGGRGKPSVEDKSGATSTSSESYTFGVPKIEFKLPKTEMTPVDMTPSGYEPKVRESKITKIDDAGNVGNSVGPKRSSEELREELKVKEAEMKTEAVNAQHAREKLEKVNQEQLARLENRNASEKVSMAEQKIQQQKQQKAAETDSSIYKQQLEVQISMAKDIRRMAETLDKMYTMPQIDKHVERVAETGDKKTIKPAQQNRHTQTVATMEPVSMKIN